MTMANDKGVKSVLASFEKTIKENNEVGVTSAMYLNNLLTKDPKDAFTTSLNSRCYRPYVRRISASTVTASSSSTMETDDWTSNHSVHSSMHIADRDDDGDSSTDSCDSFGEGDDDVEWEVPSIAADINNSRSRRGANMRLPNNACRRPNRNIGLLGLPETIFEVSGNSRHDSTSGSSRRGSNASSTSKDSRSSKARIKKSGDVPKEVGYEDYDDSDCDSFG